MKMNIKSTNTVILAAISAIILTILYFLLDLPLCMIAPVMVIIILTCLFFVMYFQKTEKPICKSCNKPLKLMEKKLISQEEEIRNQRFVFLYKYEYTYKCTGCKEVVHINKIQKNKS